LEKELKDFILMMADNVMILGQRLGEWCGHGPILEQDIAITNFALDLIGEARNYYQYLAETEGKSEDEYPMKRDVRAFKNVLLTELPNGHWGDTIMRQCMFDCYHYYLLEGMTSSENERLAAIAKKSIKEATYHLAFSGEWVIRLGDGTEESQLKMQQSLDDLMPYFNEMFIPESYEIWCHEQKIAPSLDRVRSLATEKFKAILVEASLQMPDNIYSKKGGKSGLHTENLGFILADMQYLQRSYPGVEW